MTSQKENSIIIEEIKIDTVAKEDMMKTDMEEIEIATGIGDGVETDQIHLIAIGTMKPTGAMTITE